MPPNDRPTPAAAPPPTGGPADAGGFRPLHTLAEVREALARDPENAALWNNLGVLLRREKAFNAAYFAYLRALELAPNSVANIGNAANLLRDLDRLDQAEALMRRLVGARPDDPGFRYHLALVLRDAARPSEAIVELKEARRLGQDPDQVEWEMALLHLELGDYAAGFSAYEARWRIGKVEASHGRDAESADMKPGVRVLVHSEQGFGDTIMAARFLPLLRARGVTVTLAVKPPLLALMRASDLADQVCSYGDPMPDVDLIVPAMSLPRILEIRPGAVPPPAALAVDREKVERFRAILGNPNRLKVGVVWSGSLTFEGNAKRALDLASFSKALDAAGARFYSLQMGLRRDELDEAQLSPYIRDLSPHIADFTDTAAAVSALDLIVMTDSAVAHLAGSLGRPVWNLLPYHPYWIYGGLQPDGRAPETTPWYPSMRLFRQNRPGDWDGVLRRVAGRLREAAAQRTRV